MSDADLKSLNGTQWPVAVGELWEQYRSRFATSWGEMPHHDQVSIYRLLVHKESQG